MSTETVYPAQTRALRAEALRLGKPGRAAWSQGCSPAGRFPGKSVRTALSLGVTSSRLALAALGFTLQGPSVSAAGGQPLPRHTCSPQSQGWSSQSLATLRGGGVCSPPCSVPPRPPRIRGSRWSGPGFPGFCFPHSPPAGLWLS